MKLIASANFHTAKMRDLEEYERRMREEKANMTEEEQESRAKEHKANMEQMKKQAKELMGTLRIKPRRVNMMRFNIASQRAQSIAARFGLDMRAETTAKCGLLSFFTEDFTSDNLWNDQKEMRQLLKLMRWADSVSIQEADEEREGQLLIELTFRFCKLIGKDRKRYKNLEQLLI
ncbi:MAG: hypothetical protein IJX84_12570 [Clostridia bacterium]|nr:hypothetical protein [Clostridia bacterium]